MTTTEFNSEHYKRSVPKAMRRGAALKCPKCGKGQLFAKYLKAANTCPKCSEEIFHHRADDAPPYFTMLLIGHIVFPAIFLVERNFQPPLWLHFSVWIPLLVLLSLALLPVIKGAVIGLQWALRMHGFDDPAVQISGESDG
jgi:uncharacterized protein (DUF983 family)